MSLSPRYLLTKWLEQERWPPGDAASELTRLIWGDVRRLLASGEAGDAARAFLLVARAIQVAANAGEEHSERFHATGRRL